jgi:hypothetical protein
MVRSAPFAALFSGVLLTVDSLLAVTIQFDYSLDENGFFDNRARVRTLEAAAAVYENLLTDHLTAIEPSGANWWNVIIPNPSSGQGRVMSNMTIPEDTILVFVGGRDIRGGDIASVDIGLLSGDGDEQWESTIFERGQPNAMGTDVATDFGYWGGAVTFDTTDRSGSPRAWNFRIDQRPAAHEHDFFSAALNVMTKVLGIGTADSWERWIDWDAHTFTGPHSVAEFGQPVPLNPNEWVAKPAPTHFEHVTSSDVWPDGESQIALNTSVLPRGVRKLITHLDIAALKDIGWEIAPTIALLQPGDANQDLNFDQLDIAQVLQSGKYLTDEPATWPEGDWNGMSASYPGHPAEGDGLFDQLDIVAAQQSATYLTGPQSVRTLRLVPEPSGPAMLGLAVLALMASARCGRQIGSRYPA